MDGGTDANRRQAQAFPRDAANERFARRMVAGCLDAWGLAEERPQFELIVSELFANTVLHGSGATHVVMAAGDGTIRIEVHDQGGGTPVLQPADPTGTRLGGWGLNLVDQLADAWGADVSHRRTVVWAERRRP